MISLYYQIKRDTDSIDPNVLKKLHIETDFNPMIIPEGTITMEECFEKISSECSDERIVVIDSLSMLESEIDD